MKDGVIVGNRSEKGLRKDRNRKKNKKRRREYLEGFNKG